MQTKWAARRPPARTRFVPLAEKRRMAPDQVRPEFHQQGEREATCRHDCEFLQSVSARRRGDRRRYARSAGGTQSAIVLSSIARQFVSLPPSRGKVARSAG